MKERKNRSRPRKSSDPSEKSILAEPSPAPFDDRLMDIWFDLAKEIDALTVGAAAALEDFDESFSPDTRMADPRFGDFQVNGVLPHAKSKRTNPRALAEKLAAQLRQSDLDPAYVNISIAGPGFINFTFTPRFLTDWLKRFESVEALRNAASSLRGGRHTVVDFPSANTAKQAHIGHLRPMVIGEAVARLLEFCGAKTIRDNHLGDWGTNFGTLIMKIKRDGIDLQSLGDDALPALDRLYKEGSQLEREDPELREISRAELVKLQNGDPENTVIWQQIVEISKVAFEHIFAQMDVRTDVTLGESFYRDKVQRVYDELTEIGLAEESDGALVVWHDEVPRFSRDNERPNPFNIRKKDGASNYASTDLATVLYRVEEFQAEEIIYLTDARQQDHFQQLFLTTRKWFEKTGRPLPDLHHVWWGTILGPDKKPFKTKSGEAIKLQDLLDEARARALAVVTEKNPGLSENERQAIANTVGIAAIKYADLASNRTQDYIFSWDRLLSFEGNTAPYLLYAVARIHSILGKLGPDAETDETLASPVETDAEIALARKLIGFVSVLKQAANDLRPHHICTYLFELGGSFSTFYNADRVLVDDPATRARRLLLCRRTLLILETGLRLLGITPLKRM